ncbi:GlxA family transcriptional regulator [Pantoea sp. ME81]|uniref:GlxA family transcriptional regulator n=1 Tax=Pantoea sp. ME81 TaxID=2743935 RepID=UPI0021037B84|nr:helix-turn-helix domain-containing protein [Pantoea sp. ME81]
MFINDNIAIIHDMKISILTLEGVFDTGLTALLDTFSTANELAQIQGMDVPPFQVQMVGMRKRVKSAHGLTLPVLKLTQQDRPDWVVVPALNTKQPEQLLASLNRPDVMEAQRFLQNMANNNVRIAAACLGTFLLADSGLLNGHAATTTWLMAPLFRQRYPEVLLDEARLIVDSGPYVTAGAMMGHIDLALWLVRHTSPQLAGLIAKFMLVDDRLSQTPYIIPDYLAHADPLIDRFEKWSRQHLDRGFSLQTAADALCVHPRTLQRRTEAVLGKSPLAFFQDLRVERAKQLIAEGKDIESIAADIGYADASTLLALLRRKTGKGIKELRKRTT